MQIQINISPKMRYLFEDILHDFNQFGVATRFRGVHGGRGSSKSFQLATMSALVAVYHSLSGKPGNILCLREYMNSLADSSMEEIKTVIHYHGLQEFFAIGEKYIRTKDKKVNYLFAGLNRNLDSIKSKSNIILAWIDEAEGISEMAWNKLIPTVRATNSEIWLSWNPEKDGSATDKRFRKSNLAYSRIIEMNYRDNPFFPEVLERTRLNDLENLDPSTYAWIWEGAYRVETEAQIFKGKVLVREFEIDPSWSVYYGLDFGFSNDPTAALRVFVDNTNNLIYISDEACKVGLELDVTAQYLIDRIPGIAEHVVRADSARPESISYLKRHGLPRIEGVKKGAGSVVEGISFIKSFKNIIIHPRCKETIKESTLFSYKVDRNTGDVLPEIASGYDHLINDSLRYSLEPLIRNKPKGFFSK